MGLNRSVHCKFADILGEDWIEGVRGGEKIAMTIAIFYCCIGVERRNERDIEYIDQR